MEHLFRVSASPGVQDTQLDCPYPPHSVNAQTSPVPSSPGQLPLPPPIPLQGGLAWVCRHLQATLENSPFMDTVQEPGHAGRLYLGHFFLELCCTCARLYAEAPVPACFPVFHSSVQTDLEFLLLPSFSVTASISVLFFTCFLVLV